MAETDTDLQRLADDGCPHAVQEPEPPLDGDELVEIERWAKAHAGAGSRTAQLVLRLLGDYRRQAVEIARQNRTGVPA